jgi:hypothetical protein
MKTYYISPGALCEHLEGPDLDRLLNKNFSGYIILPTSMNNCPMRIDKIAKGHPYGTGFKISYAATVEELKDGDRLGDNPEDHAVV